MNYLTSSKTIRDLLGRGIPLPAESASEILSDREINIFELLSISDRVREKNFGKTIHACAIINAKTGGCTEDCRFCSQSVHYSTNSEGWVKPQEVKRASDNAKKMGAEHLGIVAAIRGIEKGNSQLSHVLEYGEIIKKSGMEFHASLGVLDDTALEELKRSGLTMLNHNLETSERFFPNICSTHTYGDRVKTIISAKKKGIRVCCGGIIGIGETVEDRVSLAEKLIELDVDVIPLNFINPMPGTPLGKTTPLTPYDALKTLAVFRLMIPGKDIKMAGGREITLRSLQPLMFPAGATSIIIGDYLTTKGNPYEADRLMISDLGLINTGWEKGK